MELLRPFVLLSSVAIPAMAMAQTASPPPAASNSGQIGEIVVTAQRRAESLQKVPLAVTALDSRALEQKGITNLNNLATKAEPGVVITQFAGTPSTLAFNIRGAYAADPGIGLAEQGVALYQDGVPIGRAQGAGIELGDVERIELLRGPQGTLFGRNAEGGAVQFISKRPTGEFGGRLELQDGNFDAKRAFMVLNLPKIGGFSIKLSGLWDKHDGYTRNLSERTGIDQPIVGKALPDAAFHQEGSNNFADLGLKNQRGFRVAVQWQPTSTLTANYSYDYSDLNYTVAYNSRTGGRVPSLYAWCQVPEYAANPATTCAGPAAPINIINNIYYNTPTAQPLNPHYADAPTYTPESSQHVRGHGLTLEWRPSDALTFKSITGLRFLRENGFTNLGTAQIFVQTMPSSAFGSNIGQLAGFTGSVNPAKINQKQFSQEVQMLGNFGDLKLTAGLFYYYERVFDTRSSFFGMAYQVVDATTLRPIAISPIDLSGVGADGLPGSLQKFKGIAHSYAAYAQATYTPSAILDGKLSLTGGLRYTKDKKEFDRIRAALGATGADSSLFDKDRFDPAVTLAYQATSKINLYARYARAYRAGGTGIRNKLALTTYNPEVNTTYEAGVKTTLFDNHMRFNVAGFHSIIHGAQVSFQNSAADPSSTDTINVDGNIKIDGVEVESQVQFTREFGMNVGYSYMHASLGGATVTGNVADGLGGTTLVSTPIIYAPYLPKHQVNVGMDYAKPIGDSTVFLHLDYNYSSARHNNPTALNSAVEATSTLSQFNGRIGVRDIGGPGSTKFNLEFFANNLFNKKDYSYAYAVNGSDFTVALRNDAGGSAYAMPPRTFGAKATIAF